MNFLSLTNLLYIMNVTATPAALPVILLIHGIGADHQMWKPQIATLPLKGLFLVALSRTCAVMENLIFLKIFASVTVRMI